MFLNYSCEIPVIVIHLMLNNKNNGKIAVSIKSGLSYSKLWLDLIPVLSTCSLLGIQLRNKDFLLWVCRSPVSLFLSSLLFLLRKVVFRLPYYSTLES